MMLEAIALPFVLATWQIVLLMALFFALMFKRWFWFIVFTMSSLALAIESFAKLAHLNLAGALGYFLVAAVCWLFATSVSEELFPSQHKGRDGQPHSAGPDHPDWSPH